MNPRVLALLKLAMKQLGGHGVRSTEEPKG